MEEDNNQELESNPGGSRTRVGFPQAGEEKKSPGKLILLIVIILAILGGLAWYLFGREGNLPATDEITPTTFIQESTPIPIPSEEPADRSEIKTQILNGTGIARGAASLQEKLQDLGYSEFEVGNASPQNYTTATVTFDRSVPQSIQDEIIETLEEIYQGVETSSESLDEFDIEIITGYPRGYTPAPTQKVTPTTSVKPTSAAGTGTVTPTVTVSPTPTP